jgi:alpha-N-arabinofuranosidase
VAPADFDVAVAPGALGSLELTAVLPPHSFATVELDLG